MVDAQAAPAFEARSYPGLQRSGPPPGLGRDQIDQLSRVHGLPPVQYQPWPEALEMVEEGAPVHGTTLTASARKSNLMLVGCIVVAVLIAILFGAASVCLLRERRRKEQRRHQRDGATAHRSAGRDPLGSVKKSHGGPANRRRVRFEGDEDEEDRSTDK